MGAGVVIFFFFGFEKKKTHPIPWENLLIPAPLALPLPPTPDMTHQYEYVVEQVKIK